MMRRAAVTLSVLVTVAGCAHGAAPAQTTGKANATELYLGRLIAGDRAAIAAGFSDAPAIDDPFAGAVRGGFALFRFVAERHAWLTARAARLTPGRITRHIDRTVVEAVLHLRDGGRDIDLPIAVVGDEAPAGGVRALRVYHSFWPLEGRHHVRPPLLVAREPGAHIPRDDTVAEYQRFLANGDVDGLVQTFEADGYFREPSGAPYVHRGRDELRRFFTQMLEAGGIGLGHATVTDDGTACAIEFNAVRFGRPQIAPQAGLAVYERGPSGLLHAARIYDDVNVEVLSAATAE